MITIRIVSNGPPGLAVMKHRRAALEANYHRMGIPARVSLWTLGRDKKTEKRNHFQLAGGRTCRWPVMR